MATGTGGSSMDGDGFLCPFGISADTGRPLNDLSDESVAAELRRAPKPEDLALQERSTPANVAFGVVGEVDANNLSESGWGIIYAPGVDQAIKDALEPLIKHRRQSASPFVIYDGAGTAQPNETALAWLTRHHMRLDVVDPAQGMPFYLLIVAPPGAISFEFQYVLDLYWAVGRLWFETADEFRQYAESVVQYEKGAGVPTSKKIALFATEHDFDNATQQFSNHVAKPMAFGEGNTPLPLGKRQKFELQTLLGDAATKSNLADLLSGTSNGTPSLLFSGSHGMEFRAEDPRQFANQGAIVCQDWDGYGKIEADHWFSAEDVPAAAKVHGMMHVFFACHGGGCAEFDNFDRLSNQPRRIAAKPFFSRLPQRLLSHPNGGAVAILAHIERAWTYSFQNDRGTGSQTQGFRDVIGRLLRGERIGQATDVFNMRWAALSTLLAETQLDLHHGADIPLKKLGRLWVARDDARNFMIFGDPAVRLRVEDMVSR